MVTLTRLRPNLRLLPSKKVREDTTTYNLLAYYLIAGDFDYLFDFFSNFLPEQNLNTMSANNHDEASSYWQLQKVPQ